MVHAIWVVTKKAVCLFDILKRFLDLLQAKLNVFFSFTTMMSIACMMKKKRSKTLIADRERTKIVERCDKKEPMNFVDLSGLI